MKMATPFPLPGTNRHAYKSALPGFPRARKSRPCTALPSLDQGLTHRTKLA